MSSRRFRRQPWQIIEVDVTAGENYADRLTRDREFAIQDRGQRHCAAWLDDDFQDLPDESHRAHDAVLADRDDVVGKLSDQRKCQIAERGAQSVSDRPRLQLRYDAARPE